MHGLGASFFPCSGILRQLSAFGYFARSPLISREVHALSTPTSDVGGPSQTLPMVASVGSRRPVVRFVSFAERLPGEALKSGSEFLFAKSFRPLLNGTKSFEPKTGTNAEPTKDST